LSTIYDVARAAGVSPKTVSRVLNDEGPVNDQTRSAVRAAMRRLGYVPSRSARSLRSQRSGLIGLITGAISITEDQPTGLPDMLIVQGVQRVLSEHRMTLMVADTGGDMARVPDLVRTFLEHRVEALCIVAEYHQEIALEIAAGGIPVLLVNCFGGANTPAIVPDDALGGYLLTKGLIERGHRRIGVLTLPRAALARRLRLGGYRRALSEAGIAYDPALVAVGMDADPARPIAPLPMALQGLLALAERPTVICCGNDFAAMHAYALLAEWRIKVPKDISIAGYDDYRLVAELLRPPLTSVDLPYLAMGRRAGDVLIQLIEGTLKPEDIGKEAIAGRVIWRESVKPNRTSRAVATGN
jgi:LacI family transcriptional regulator